MFKVIRFEGTLALAASEARSSAWNRRASSRAILASSWAVTNSILDFRKSALCKQGLSLDIIVEPIKHGSCHMCNNSGARLCFRRFRSWLLIFIVYCVLIPSIPYLTPSLACYLLSCSKHLAYTLAKVPTIYLKAHLSIFLIELTNAQTFAIQQRMACHKHVLGNGHLKRMQVWDLYSVKWIYLGCK